MASISLCQLTGRLVARGGIPVVLALGLAPAAAAQTTTFGASLSQAPDVGFDCTAFPIGNGGTQTPLGNDSSCTWSTPTNATAPSEGMLTPAGTGTIAAVRVRVGPTTGPMELVVLQVTESAFDGSVSCCEASYVSPPFTPTANSITTLPTDLPVHTDAPGQQSSPGLEVGDILALSILEDGVPIPAIDETGSGLPANQLPTDNVEFPAFVQGQNAIDSGTYGYQLDMNADWVEGTPSPPPTPTVGPTPLVTPTITPTPTVTLGRSTPSVKGGDVHVKLGCGAAAACKGTLAIESKPLAGTAAAKKPKHSSAPIVYAKGSFKLSAGAEKSVSAPLTAKGRSAARGHKRIDVYIDLTYGAGPTAKRISHRVKLRF
jgi:hypothetical protein